MMKPLLLILTLSLAGLTACDKAQAPTPPSSPQAPKAPKSPQQAKTPQAPRTPKAPKALTVQVAKEGTKFDPPIQASKLPDGAYYCDMGTVHYARMEKGDNKCTLCGMALKHKK